MYWGINFSSYYLFQWNFLRISNCPPSTLSPNPNLIIISLPRRLVFASGTHRKNPDPNFGTWNPSLFYARHWLLFFKITFVPFGWQAREDWAAQSPSGILTPPLQGFLVGSVEEEPWPCWSPWGELSSIFNARQFF